ncbi:hypothetical protein ACNQUF_12645, partial [Corynebacterium diphtheriae]
LARCVTRVLELDLAQRTNRVYGGGYEAYLEERATLRRQAREKYEEFAEQKQDLVSRAAPSREWSLARCVTRVLELDLAQRTNRVYGGGYEAYLEERA